VSWQRFCARVSLRASQLEEPREAQRLALMLGHKSGTLGRVQRDDCSNSVPTHTNLQKLTLPTPGMGQCERYQRIACR
jgi:hypothetical protein